jgi:hypothetical protein
MSTAIVYQYYLYSVQDVSPNINQSISQSIDLMFLESLNLINENSSYLVNYSIKFNTNNLKMQNCKPHPGG